MKQWMLICLLLGGVAAVGQEKEKEKQSLKDLLYSGKLKKDSSGVVRKTDDLSTKIDTSTKKEPEPVKAVVPVSNSEAVKEVSVAPADSSVNVTANSAVTTEFQTTVAPAKTASPKTNTRLWKEYTDSLVKSLEPNVLKSKQIKKNTYFMMVDYEIEVDGKVNVLNVSSTPENAFLQANVKQWMDNTPLVLNPVTDSNKEAKKVKRKQQVMITKD